MKSRSGLKLGHIGSETRSPGQILEKPFVHFRGHSSNAIFMKLCQCFSHLNLEQDQNWVVSGQKLGHKVKS